ncbi:hypothetical protein Tco_1163265 [Tanacetum coccineum]
MIGCQILCSFFVSDDNIEFLEQKDPPHQSRLSILFSEEILYSRVVSIYNAHSRRDKTGMFSKAFTTAKHSEVVGNAVSFPLP